jgi:hypothetical protein
LTSDGRRWLIPATALEGRHAITLGGSKYAEFEIEPATSIRSLVYAEDAPLKSDTRTGEYPRGQRTATVNRQAQPSQVRLLPPPLSSTDSDSPGSPVPRFQPSKYERRLGKSGQAVINQKRRLTLPQQALAFAGLRDGDRVQARADGPGRIVLEKVGLPVWAEPA